MEKDITKSALTACMQYFVAAGETQGKIACTLNVLRRIVRKAED
jgi:hypothetical protein